MKNKIALLIATLIVGSRTPYMGTVGSVLSIPVCWVAVWLFHSGVGNGALLYGAVSVLVLWVGVWSVPIAEKILGSRLDPWGKQRLHDQNQIAIDETLGMLVAAIPLLLVPQVFWWHYVLVCVVFRVFDIVKIWPAKRFDQLESAWGVMLDDAAAGVYAGIVVYVLTLFI